jgi:hypothetical protein
MERMWQDTSLKVSINLIPSDLHQVHPDVTNMVLVTVKLYVWTVVSVVVRGCAWYLIWNMLFCQEVPRLHLTLTDTEHITLFVTR